MKDKKIVVKTNKKSLEEKIKELTKKAKSGVKKIKNETKKIKKELKKASDDISNFDPMKDMEMPDFNFSNDDDFSINTGCSI